MLSVLVVIPARGGSKGIPRKNLCPIAGHPLIAWSIRAALGAEGVTKVIVSTDDDEIERVAGRYGASVVRRDPRLAEDAVTLDPVIWEAVQREEAEGRAYDVVLTVQPTSPLLRSATIERIIQRLSTEELDTIITAIDDTHLAWEKRDGVPVPAYEKRLNRQQLAPRFKETGGVLGTRRGSMTPHARIGQRVGLQVLEGFEGLDIDSRDDWLTAEAALGRRKIAFIVIGNERQGLGHVTRVLTLLECLNGHEVHILCEPQQELAIARFTQKFYPVQTLERAAITNYLVEHGIELVVHDELDTDPEEIAREKGLGMKVVVFEDQGPGMALADLVFNELFSESESVPGRHRYFGPSVYCLRDEFAHAVRREPVDEVRRILVTFGGTDPARLTFKVLEMLAAESVCPVTVVAGRGLPSFPELEARVKALQDAGRDFELLRDVRMMSEEMGRADLAFSSAGRTLYELAHMGVPSIVMAQNDVEMHHTFASVENGFLFLGKGEAVAEEQLRVAFRSLYEGKALRLALRNRMLTWDLTGGRDRVVRTMLEYKK